VDVTIHEVIVGTTVAPAIASYSPYYPPHDSGWHESKDVVLIMPSGWTASGGVGVRSRGAKQSGPTEHDGGRGHCAGGTSVKSRETDRENGYKNRSPVFSYERSPNFGDCDNRNSDNVGNGYQH